MPSRTRIGVLTLLCAASLLSMLAARATQTPASVPALPPSGSELPTAGASLFDQLFGRQTLAGIAYTVPYPFERLLATLRARLQARPDRASPVFATALVPLGRSLHRAAADPEFFRHPRIVLAVDVQGRDRLSTRDRLFLGYQEKAEQIEIISYNAALGRFEFQLVSDYAAGKTPVVEYARRPLCTSCHQNGGPLFPRAPWSETNSDPRMAARIRAHHPSGYHGVATDSIFADSGRIDSATDRANLFSSYQRIWREACEMPKDRSASLRCRADAFYAMLRFRLGIWSGGLPQATTRHQAYRRVVAASWGLRWPGGLAVPDADLPDRRPLLHRFDTELQPRLDPLRARPPRARWTAERSMDRVIEGLAESFLLGADIERLDRALHRRAMQSRMAITRVGGVCEVEPAGAGSFGHEWTRIRCLQFTAAGDELDLEAELVTDERGQVHDGLSWLFISDDESVTYAALSGRFERTPGGGIVAQLSCPSAMTRFVRGPGKVRQCPALSLPGARERQGYRVRAGFAAGLCSPCRKI